MCGKKNIGANSTFLFNFEESEQTGIPITQIGRNITRMNMCVKKFFDEKPKDSDFMLYIGNCFDLNFFEIFNMWARKKKGFYYKNFVARFFRKILGE